MVEVSVDPNNRDLFCKFYGTMIIRQTDRKTDGKTDRQTDR